MNLIRNMFYSLPVSLRYWVRRIVYLPLDIIYPLEGAPPRGMIYTGGGDFIETGNRFLVFFKEYGKLKPTDQVLDIGSGIGRMAIPLTKYLNPTTRYEGFDLVKAGVDWCQKNISSKYPNFNFRYIALDNDLYTAKLDSASEFIFPYEDRGFDFCFLISVFTHMLPDEVSQYLNEMHRCLDTGGRVFFTCFSYENEARLNTNPKFSFPYQYESYALMDEKVKSANVAFSKQWLMAQIQASGFEIISEHNGHWDNQSTKNETLDFQDIWVLGKM